MTTLTNDIAAIIRKVDGNNRLTATQLGWGLAYADKAGLLERACLADLTAFIERTNPDKKMGAGHLAELLVAEFDLDKECL